MVVMVVDDQEMQLYLVGCQLSSAGHRIIGCHSGEEAVAKLNLQAVDMVITDMEMGVMSGEHALKYVREQFGSLPVILMSGNPDNLMQDGFDGYLAKLFSMRALLAAVENARR